MGYRGEDASRSPAAWGELSPGGSPAGTGPGGAGSWDNGSQQQWQDDFAAGYGEYAPGDPRGGYGQRDDGYGPADSFDRQHGGGRPGGYNDHAAGYGAGGLSGNDWYGGQPDAASGSGFADTSTYSLGAGGSEEYGTGPRQVRGFPPAPSQPLALPSGFAASRYDDLAEDGPDGYDPQGYGPDGYGPDGYGPVSDDPEDGYDDYGDTGIYPDAFDGMRPSGRAGRPRGRDRASGARPRRGGRTLLLAALAVVVAGVAGTAGYKYWLAPGHAADTAAQQPLPTSGPSASTPACVQQFGTYCHIELRTNDPAPLTLAELFPPAFQNEQDHAGFGLAATKLDKTCSSAVLGTDLQNALEKGNCSQVLRASYVSSDGKIMGTIGVVNLATTNEAHYAGKVVGQNDFITPLTASKGPASKLGQATGVVESEFKGHYLILTWAEFTSGTTPSTPAQEQQLEQWEADLVAGTVNISLSQRMVNGAPATPATPSSTGSPSATASRAASASSSPSATASG